MMFLIYAEYDELLKLMKDKEKTASLLSREKETSPTL